MASAYFILPLFLLSCAFNVQSWKGSFLQLRYKAQWYKTIKMVHKFRIPKSPIFKFFKFLSNFELKIKLFLGIWNFEQKLRFCTTVQGELGWQRGGAKRVTRAEAKPHFHAPLTPVKMTLGSMLWLDFRDSPLDGKINSYTTRTKLNGTWEKHRWEIGHNWAKSRKGHRTSKQANYL